MGYNPAPRKSNGGSGRASSEAPVSIRAGYANPAWATTSEIGVSGGSVTRYRMEAAAWLLPHPKSAIYLDYRRCSPRYTDNYRKNSPYCRAF
nr:ash family protein [Klebsiella pneumoniae subsp. pneumoniae]